MTGAEELQRAKAAGFTDEELAEWLAQERERARKAGFSMQEFDAYWGIKSFDDAPIKALIADNIATSPKPVTNLLEAFQAGLQLSVPGLAIRGDRPSLALPEDADRLTRITAMAGNVLGDLPTFAAGAVIGGASGGPIGATAGAFALQSGLARILMDKYEKGEVRSFREFWDRMLTTAWETLKGYAVGAATGAAGQAVRGLKLASPTAELAAATSAEVATMVAVGNALEGKVPEPDDFIDAAIILAGVKGASQVASKLRRLYAQYGVHPHDAVRDAERDVTIKQDLLSTTVPVPRIYADRLADQLAKERAAERDDKPKLIKRKKTLPELAQEAILPKAKDAEPQPLRPLTELAQEAILPLEPPSKALRSAEDILRDRELMKAREREEAARQSPQPEYRLPKGGKVVISDEDMAEFRSILTELGIQIGEEGRPKWMESAPPVNEAVASILEKVKWPSERPTSYTLHGLYTSLIDRLHPIKQAVPSEPDITKDPYRLERLIAGTVGRAEAMLKFGVTDFDTYQTVTRGYFDILKPVVTDLDNYVSYIVAKRVLEKEAQGIATGFDVEQARQVVTALKAKMEPVHREHVAYRHKLLEQLKKAGFFDEATFQVILRANEDYVPFYRFFEDRPEGKPARSGLKQPIKKMEGSARDIHHPLISDIKNVFLFAGLAEKNAARLAYVDRGLGTLLTKEKRFATKEQIKEIVEELGVTDEAAQAIAALHPKSHVRRKDSELVVFRNGVREVWEVHPEVARAFEHMDTNIRNLAVKILFEAPASLLRAGVVVTPEYISRNLIRDAVAAFVTASSHPIKTLKGAKSLLAHDEVYQKWLKGGGANATMVAIDKFFLEHHIGKLHLETGLLDRVWNIVRTPYDLLHLISEFVENSTRLGAVHSELQRAQTKAAIQALAFLAREATVDFSRVGADTAKFARVTAFFNPHLQGLDRFIRALKDDPAGVIPRALLAVTLPSIVLWWAQRDNEHIQRLPSWRRFLFWNVAIPTDDGKTIIASIPKPHEIGVLFGTLPELVLERFFADNPGAFHDFNETMLDVFLPGMLPTTTVPIIAQATNRHPFTSGPLIPSDLQGLIPAYQYTDYTTELAKAIGQAIGAFPGMERAAIESEHPMIGGVARALTSPVLIEQYVRMWTGGMGYYVLQAADALLRKSGVLPDPVKPADTLADIPFVKAFVVRYPSAGAAPVQEFFERFATHEKVWKTIQQQQKEGNVAEVEALMARYEQELPRLTSFRQALVEHSQAVRMIAKDPGLSADEKAQLIDTLLMRRIEIAEEGVRIMRQLSEDSTRRKQKE